MNSPHETVAPDAGSAALGFEQRLRQAPEAARIAALVAIAALYFLAARYGLRLAFAQPNTTVIWPPAGLALVGFLVFGRQIWPAILVGAFFANLTVAGHLITALAIALGNTLEGLTGAYLVNRFANGLRAMNRAQDVFRLAVFAALLSTTVSATIGVTSLTLDGFARWQDYGQIWFTWWLGDASNDLLVVPALLAWMSSSHVRWKRGQAAEAVILFAALLLVSMMVFGGLIPAPLDRYPQGYLCIPFVIWTAFRFGLRETATAILALAALSISGTLHGLGPFVQPTWNASLLQLQVFMAVTCVMSLALAVVVSQGRDVEEQLRQLSVSDPLTGLANYRLLMQVIEKEIRRSLRTNRSFAILFADVDGLKHINDRYGHVAGSDAVKCVADALRASCRAVDTAARYGGDEFAVVFPEADAAIAREVGMRVNAQLARSNTKFTLSVSTGITEFPRDGTTAEALLHAADGVLYAAKEQRKTAPAARV